MLLLNGQQVKGFKFSGGELQIRLPEVQTEGVILAWKPTCADDIMELLLTVNALKHEGITDIDLDVLYLPYARQDRVCAKGEAFSLEVIVKILDSLEVSMIRLWDIHNSELTLDLFKNSNVRESEQHDIFARFKILDEFALDNLILCAPDAGAWDKVNHIVNRFELGMAVHCEKVRDPSDGSITGLKINQYSRDVDSWNILVVDDICDGGRTFIEVAKALKKAGAANLFLYVTHGIFSKGLEELYEYYNHIYCHHVLHDDQFHNGQNLTILRTFNHVS